MFDLDALIANKDLILKDRDNRADVQKVLSVYAEKVSDDYVVKAKWEDIFSALLQGMKVQAQVVTFVEADEEAETDASAVVETYELYDATVTADGFKVNGTDLSAASADAYPVGSLSRPSSGGGGEGGGVLVCTEDEETGALNHTWQEIYDAVDGGSMVILKEVLQNGIVIHPVLDVHEPPYSVSFTNYTVTDGYLDVATYTADSSDDYPVNQDGGGGGGR